MKKFILSMGAVALMLTITSCSNNTEKETGVDTTDVVLVENDSVCVDTVCECVPTDSVVE